MAPIEAAKWKSLLASKGPACTATLRVHPKERAYEYETKPGFGGRGDCHCRMSRLRFSRTNSTTVFDRRVDCRQIGIGDLVLGHGKRAWLSNTRSPDRLRVLEVSRLLRS